MLIEVECVHVDCKIASSEHEGESGMHVGWRNPFGWHCICWFLGCFHFRTGGQKNIACRSRIPPGNITCFDFLNVVPRADFDFLFR